MTYDFSKQIDFIREFAVGIHKTTHARYEGSGVVILNADVTDSAADELLQMAEWLARLEEKLNAENTNEKIDPVVSIADGV